METQYTVTMIRPEFSGQTVRTITLAEPAKVVSDRQLAGFLTHLLFSREERGEYPNTYFTVEERNADVVNVFTVRRAFGRTYHKN